MDRQKNIMIVVLAAALALGVKAGTNESGGLKLAAKKSEPEDPELTIPFCRKPPVIDGKLSPDEWKYAAAVSMFEWGTMRQEQPVFYVFRDAANLYVAMESIDSNHNGIMAKCPLHDHLSIIGDDCLELMIAPGAGDLLKQFDFPTYYFAVNSIGTIWDCKFIPLLAEDHNSWESGAEIANEVDGTYWSCEMRIPLTAISKDLPKNGTVWRMNFDRTYFGYNWNAWKKGALNDARVGGNVTFDDQAPAIRLLSVNEVADGKLNVVMEVANSTDKEQKVKLSVKCLGQNEPGKEAAMVGQDEKEVTVKPGAVQEVRLGGGQKLSAYNKVALEAVDSTGKRLFAVKRRVDIPAPRLAKHRTPKVPMVSIFPRFLPSLERLAVAVDYTAWAKKTGYVGAPPRAEVLVFKKGEEPGKPVMEGTLTEFKANQGTWRGSTKDLPEGEYVVKVKVLAGKGEMLADYDDWFEKKIFDWMKDPRGVGDEVPELYEPLMVKGSEVKLWGRTYRFDEAGLPASVVSQGKELLSKKVQLLAEINGKPVEVKVTEPFRVVNAKPAKVEGKTVLSAGDLKIELECTMEYDGFILYRLTYGPRNDKVNLNRLRVKVPLQGKYAKFYSASGDNQGVTVLGDVLPDKPGRVFDSLNDTRSVCCSPTFANLFWVADYDTCFCYAADNDKGWLIRDDAPAVEAYREGEELVLWLNLVDKAWELTAPRTLEFAFQAGPTKALPEGWRGIQNGGNTNDAPLTFNLVQYAGSGYTLAGGTHFIHPGNTPEQQKRSKEKIEKAIAGGNKAVGGYHYWGNVPKGFPETRVFRGEWGIDKETWDSNTQPREWEWKNRFYGEDKDLCIIMSVAPVPSYVDFATYAYDEALKHTALSGFYDDTGYPKPVFDEELGLGFVREDGRKVYSSGLWIYRERWKQAAYVNHKYKRPNYTWDSQHVHAHYMPAYGFIGIWAPCEHGYYNPFKDRDNLDFYGSLERYVAFNPSRQFGQIAMIGMASPQKDPALKARDTRCMMMLALLNDQDVGSWGSRDLLVVRALRHARNGFKPWEKEVEFIGYWQNGEWVKADKPEVKMSLYHRPDGALFIMGNVGTGDVETVVEPDWGKLKLEPGRLSAVNAENGEKMDINTGSSGKGFKIKVPRHDVRMVVVGPEGKYVDAGKPLGK